MLPPPTMVMTIWHPQMLTHPSPHHLAQTFTMFLVYCSRPPFQSLCPYPVTVIQFASMKPQLLYWEGQLEYVMLTFRSFPRKPHCILNKCQLSPRTCRVWTLPISTTSSFAVSSLPGDSICINWLSFSSCGGLKENRLPREAKICFICLLWNISLTM